MKIHIQLSDMDPVKGSYHRIELADLKMNITPESIPAVCALLSSALEQHLITRLHAESLGVNPEKEELPDPV